MGKLESTKSKIEKIDFSLREKTQRRLDFLTKPQGSLGKLEDIAKQIVEVTKNENPKLKNKLIVTMAGDHGVAKEGVSAFPQEVTPQMVYNFLNGGAGINVLARHAGARVAVVDIGVAVDLNPHKDLIVKKINYGTKNFLIEPAMTRDEAVRAIEAGIEVFEEEYVKGVDIVGTGDMGIANTTASTAIVSCITGEPVENVIGKGTGIDDKALINKINVVKKALELHKPNPKDALDVLSKVGGYEIAGLAGVILGAVAHRVPVVVDGFISGAAALIAYQFEPKVKDYLIASHCSVEKGHKVTLDYIGISPILNLNLRLGEGTGAALAMTIIDASVKILNEMATFDSAGVSNKI